jgi:hypothetical protein
MTQQVPVDRRGRAQGTRNVCDLEVYATTKDGIQLAPYDYYFFVN